MKLTDMSDSQEDS